MAVEVWQVSGGYLGRVPVTPREYFTAFLI